MGLAKAAGCSDSPPPWLLLNVPVSDWRVLNDLRVLCVFAPPGADLTVAEASSSDSRGERAELYGHVDEGLLGGEASYLGPPLTPEKDEALQQAAAVANLRAALMSKNSLLSLKADVLGDDSSLLLEYLPKGTHSLSRKCVAECRGGGGGVRTARGGGGLTALAWRHVAEKVVDGRLSGQQQGLVRRPQAEITELLASEPKPTSGLPVCPGRPERAVCEVGPAGGLRAKGQTRAPSAGPGPTSACLSSAGERCARILALSPLDDAGHTWSHVSV